MEQSLTVDENDKHTPHGHIAAYFPSQELGGHLHKLFPMAALQDCKANILSVRQYLIKDPTGAWYKKYPEKFGEKLPDDEANFWEWGMTNLNNNELSARTNLHNFCNTVKAGLHNAVVSPRKRHALLVLLLLGAALCAAIYWPYHLPLHLRDLCLYRQHLPICVGLPLALPPLAMCRGRWKCSTILPALGSRTAQEKPLI